MKAHTVVVGAGAAGCVIASRLSEQGVDVVLLEAGPDYTAQALPADLRDGTRNSYHAHDWGLKHRPTRRQMRFPLPRGRVVGGSSAVNTCIALRGTARDYDEWAELGLTEWSWDSCLPAFKRLERDLDFGQAAYHGDRGPLPIRRHRPEEFTPWQAGFFEACTALGYPSCPDHNEPEALGVGPTPLNHIAGHRVSAAEAWLGPAVRARGTLRIVPDALGVKVKIERGRVVGVEAIIRGQTTLLEAERVVLCGGAIATPGLLLRSGIGPEKTLRRLGIPLTVKSPVAERILDHPGLAFFLQPLKIGVSQPRAPLMQTSLRLGSKFSAHEAALLIQPGSFFATPYADLPWVSLMVGLEKPVGVGTMHWPSADPGARPTIESRFLSEPRDLDQATEALTLALEIAEHPRVSALARPVLPWRGLLKDPSRLRGFAPFFCDSSYHPCGSVPMGPASAAWAVCDGRGNVRGVEGLVVGDASLFPTIPSANTHVPTLMVAERIAEFLGQVHPSEARRAPALSTNVNASGIMNGERIHSPPAPAPLSLPNIEPALDGREEPSRPSAVLELTGRQLAQLFDACAENPTAQLADLVPTDTPRLVEVIHHGKNSLPVFSHFRKRFCRPPSSNAHELWGYNDQPFRAITGPGYFVVRQQDSGELVIDYGRLPTSKPASWPPIVSNSSRLSRFVFDGNIDVLRRVSRGVTVGRVYRYGRATDAWFALVVATSADWVEPSKDPC